MAGSVAAMAAASAGASTVLVRSSGGATSLSSGAIDILGYLPGSDEFVRNPLKALADKALGADHPFRVMGKAGPDVIREALGFVRDRLSREGLDYAGDPAENILLPTPLGTFKPTALAPATVAPGNLLTADKKKVLVVGLTGYGGLNAEHFAQSLTYLGSAYLRQLGGSLSEASAVRVSVPGLEGRTNLAPQTVARALDAEGAALKLARDLLPEVRRTGATFVFLPIAGDKRAATNLGLIARELGCKVAEVLTVPPSWHGHVLDRALEAAVQRAGIRALTGYRASGTAKGGKMTISAHPVLAGAEVTVKPKAVVLATGDVLGGGLEAAKRVISEAVFRLPVAQSGGASSTSYLTWSDTELFPADGHPVTALGLETDATGRVRADQSRFGNIFAAGSVLRGSRRHSQKCGLGLSAASGWIAGRSAAECL